MKNSQLPQITGLRRFLNLLPRPLRRQKLLIALYRFGLISPVQELQFNDGCTAWVDLRDAESRATYIAQAFWPMFHPMVAAFLRTGGDFFDVGANFGFVTFGVVPLVRGLGIGFHLFEANHRIIPCLRNSSQIWPGERFVINHCCVTDQSGMSDLCLPDSSWGHAYIGNRGDAVPNLLLDEYIDSQRIKRVAFMKMDIEGWETKALTGGKRALSAGVIEAGFIEAHPITLQRDGTTPDELLDLLDTLGFDSYFCGLWEYTNAYELRWATVSVNGTLLRLAPAAPLPKNYIVGDFLVVHRSTSLSQRLREGSMQ